MGCGRRRAPILAECRTVLKPTGHLAIVAVTAPSSLPFCLPAAQGLLKYMERRMRGQEGNGGDDLRVCLFICA